VGNVVSPLDFEEWYLAQHPRLYASLVVFTGNPDLAWDATDEAFTRALQRWKSVRVMDSPEGWTYRVAINVARRASRRRRHEHALLSRLGDEQVVAAPAGEIWELVRALPERQRMAVTLRYLADLREPDIAAVMGITRGTVASTLAKARRSLGELLADPTLTQEPT
jgi:RNA polymerase sigma factor (sigma-70 family)